MHLKISLLLLNWSLPILSILLAATAAAAASQPNIFEQNEPVYNGDEELEEALKSVDHKHDNNLYQFDLIQRAWHEMDKRYREHMVIQINRSRPYVLQLLRESNSSPACRLAIEHLLNGLESLDLWAMQMWNSWGNFPPPGWFEGSFTDLGSYTGCLNIQDNELIGESKYCTLDFVPLMPTRPIFHSILKKALDVDPVSGRLTRGDYEGFIADDDTRGTKLNSGPVATGPFRARSKPKSMTNDDIIRPPGLEIKTETFAKVADVAQFFWYVKLRIGSCWPSKCSKDDIQNITQLASVRAVVQASPISCVSKSERESLKLNNYQLVALIVLGGLGSLVGIASILDSIATLLRFLEFENLANGFMKRINTFVDIYSFQRNFQKLFHVVSEPKPSKIDGKDEFPKQIPCVNGLKFISMIWIIYGHTLLIPNYQSFTHGFDSVLVNLVDFWIMPTLITNFSVDTFFVISGLLSAYVIFSLKIKFNGVLFTVARYARLTPQLLIVILFFFLLPLLGDGPLYKQGTQDHAERCFKNYWLNLLYLQSYINRPEMCMIPSWWLSIEMTFHIISMPVIYLMIRRPAMGNIVNFATALILTLIGAYFHYTSGFAIQYLPSIPQRFEVELEQTQKFFHRPWPHGASYFLGVALGYVFAKGLVRRLRIYQLVLGWLVCIAGFLTSLFSCYYWNLGKPYEQLFATVYYNTCQVLWPISVSWIIYVCYVGQGGFVDKILSANFFVPLGRITYMTYLSHMVVVYRQAAAVHLTQEPSFMNFYYIIFTNIMLSLLLGMFASLIYEAPIKNLQKILLEKTFSPAKTKSASKDTDSFEVGDRRSKLKKL